MRSPDIVIIGAGIVGLATARALTRAGGEAGHVRVLEKEPGVARHQSTHNSGVLHAGLQYAPGSAKARLAHDGLRRMVEYCREHSIAHEQCGKLVVAVREDEAGRLDALLERGRQNGLSGLRRLDAAEAREIEPHVQCVAAIHVAEEGIVDFASVCGTMAGEVERAGGEIRTGADVRRIVQQGTGWVVETTAGAFHADVLVNCAGLHADRIAQMADESPPCRIVPFRGEYHRLKEARAHLVRHLIYPLPEPGFPFLGVHFTRRITGSIDAGPNAVLALAREGYHRTDLDVRDLADALRYGGLWRFVARHRSMVARELAQSFDRRRFVRALQRLIPAITGDDLDPAAAGVRAQAILPTGEFVDDFLWIERPAALHVLNAPSPAATASLAIGDVLASRVRVLIRRGV